MPQSLSQFWGLLAFFGIAGLLIHSLWQAGQKRPNATDLAPAGVGGVLLIAGAYMFLGGLYDAAAAALAWQNAQAAAAQSAREAFAASAGINAAACLLFFAGSLRLFLGRSPAVRAQTAAVLVLAGPAAEALGAAVAGLTLTADGAAWFAGLCAATLWGVWACAFSARARHTYGSRRR